MPRLISLTLLPYDGKYMKKGKEFDASDKDAALLVLLGKAELAPKKIEAKTSASMSLRVEKTSVEKKEKTTRTYRRKDMTAEDIAAPEKTVSTIEQQGLLPCAEAEKAAE